MNTPKTRKRNTRVLRAFERMDADDPILKVNWSYSITDPEFLRTYGKAISLWPMIEDVFVTVLANLLGDNVGLEVATETFHALVAQNTRLPILNALLQNTHQNADKPECFDDVIDEFKRLNDKRNELIHGYWVTNADTNEVHICPSRRGLLDALREGRVVSRDEINQFIMDCYVLRERIMSSGEFPRPPTFAKGPREQ